MHKIPLFDLHRYGWMDAKPVRNNSYVCGFCSNLVSSDRGYSLVPIQSGSLNKHAGIRICPNCGGPTFFTNENEQIPAASLGSVVAHVPDDLNGLYEEARRCTTNNCYTAAVLLCRKMLMNIAVHKGAKKNKPFKYYVEFLSAKNYVPPDGKDWVDHIRDKGNEATHEIPPMSEEDAKNLLTFVAMLLKTNYEFPALIKKPAPAISPGGAGA